MVGVVLGSLVLRAGVVVGQFDPFGSLFWIVVPGQHLNWYVAQEPVVVVSVAVGLGVVTQLVPSLFLLFVFVPGQHPNFQALHAGVVLAVVALAAVVVAAPASAADLSGSFCAASAATTRSRKLFMDGSRDMRLGSTTETSPRPLMIWRTDRSRFSV